MKVHKRAEQPDLATRLSNQNIGKNFHAKPVVMCLKSVRSTYDSLFMVQYFLGSLA